MVREVIEGAEQSQQAFLDLNDSKWRETCTSVARYVINIQNSTFETRHGTYIRVMKDSGIEDHMVNPRNGSQCSYLSGEVLGSVRLYNQSMKLVRRVH